MLEQTVLDFRAPQSHAVDFTGDSWAGSRFPRGLDSCGRSFERGDQYFTVGVRLRAGKGSSKVDKDWFTTSSRPGVDLRLLDENRTPLSRVNLKEAVEASGSGRVYASAEDYRAAVRATLFPELSAEQYDALLAALLALRVEKVSQNISPEKLGEILTASLPPLDEREVAGLAEGFEKLDRRKEETRPPSASISLRQRSGQAPTRLRPKHPGPGIQRGTCS